MPPQTAYPARRGPSTAAWFVLGTGLVLLLAGCRPIELFGPVTAAPVLAAPPTPTVGAPPAAPGKLVVAEQVCTDQTYTVTLRWTDVEGNDGTRVFRDGSLIATLGANATEYTDAPPSSGPFTYGVEAYNAAGASMRPTVVEPGCVY